VAISVAVAALAVTGEWWAGLVTAAILMALILAAEAVIVIVPERKAAVIRNRSCLIRRDGGGMFSKAERMVKAKMAKTCNVWRSAGSVRVSVRVHWTQYAVRGG
jgi:hypothetical protein